MNQSTQLSRLHHSSHTYSLQLMDCHKRKMLRMLHWINKGAEWKVSYTVNQPSPCTGLVQWIPFSRRLVGKLKIIMKFLYVYVCMYIGTLWGKVIKYWTHRDSLSVFIISNQLYVHVHPLGVDWGLELSINCASSTHPLVIQHNIFNKHFTWCYH